VLAAVLSLPDPFDTPFMQRALLEALMLSVLGGVLGSWIVLRRLAFFTHGVGTAAFPGLVVAVPWGIAPQLAAFGAGLLYAGGTERLARTRRVAPDAATGLLLVGALALGVVLASDVFESGAGVDRLLFGSLIGLSDRDLWLTAAAVVGVLALDAALRRAWLAGGFDPAGARSLGVATAAADRLLLVAIAAAVVVALDAVGALLVTAVFVIPAATVRLLVEDVRALQLGAVALAAVESVIALWLADALNVGPGPALAMLGGGVFAAVALAGAARRWKGSDPVSGGDSRGQTP
jgi:ABC-type Mn2+/Zn2+ transport system permease subunit